MGAQGLPNSRLAEEARRDLLLEDFYDLRPAKARADVLDANLFSIVTAQSIFVPGRLEQPVRSAVVNLVSKEGITTPPGIAAHSVAKAGVRVLTEQFAHQPCKATGDHGSAYLWVFGYIWMPMNATKRPEGSDKPQEAWTADELVAHFETRFRTGDFYILCPDNSSRRRTTPSASVGRATM